tara:strand:+ start:7912 stop:8763 length:852 start_codon:yes stop_codon:yes gene_type:complete
VSRGRTPSTPQRGRNANNPFPLGTFDQLTLRVLTGDLGPVYKPVGFSDTLRNSNGGMGGGTYNNWFQITLAAPAWIILTKGPFKPRDLNISVYDTNQQQKVGRIIFQKERISTKIVTRNFNINPESVTISLPRETRMSYEDWEKALAEEIFYYYPFQDTVAAEGSDLYNTFESNRIDKGDEMFYPLPVGKYLVCISMTRNEPRPYEVGVVIETEEDVVNINCEDESIVNLGLEEDCDLLGDTNPGFFNTFHDHSLSQWQSAWRRDNKPNSQLPLIFYPLLNKV